MKKYENTKSYSSPSIRDLRNKIDPEKLLRTKKKMLLATKIDDARNAKGWSKKELAEKMGRKPSQISNWLAGIQNFKLDTLLEIESILNIELVNVGEKKEMVQAYSILLNINTKAERQDSYITTSYSEVLYEINEPSEEYHD